VQQFGMITVVWKNLTTAAMQFKDKRNM